MPTRKNVVNTQIVTVTKKQLPQPKRNNNKPSKQGKSKPRPARSGKISLQDNFSLALTRPDITGPVRIPREGGSSRTVLGMDKSFFQFGSITGYALVTMNPGYTDLGSSHICEGWSGASASANWVAGTAINIGSQFPISASLVDVNLVAANLVVDYIGAPLNVTGEILIGSIPSNTDPSTSSFNTLSFYPGVVRMPLADLLTQGSKSVFATKMSPAAYSFVKPNVDNTDLMMPFIALSIVAAANAVSVTATRTFECRSAITSSGTLYEKSAESFTSDLNQFQDVVSNLAELTHPITDGYGEYVREMALGLLGSRMSQYVTLGTGALLNGLSAFRMNQLRRAIV